MGRLKQLIRALPFHVSLWRPRRKWDEDRVSYQRLHADLEIEPGSRVLDIGSGGYAFPAATVLMDHFPGETHHRHEPLVTNGRLFLQADVQRIPFADGAFDFVYCSHLLEHVEDPIEACAEIMRVGHRGFIETPNFAKDVLFGWSAGMHRWHTVGIADRLIFIEYSGEQLRGVRSTAWRDLVFSPIDHPIQRLFYENQEFFNTMFEWRGRFRVDEYRLDGSHRSLE